MTVSRVSRLPIAAAVIAGAVLMTGFQAMALFGANVFFSEVSGIVVKDGQPVAGVEIVQNIYAQPETDFAPAVSVSAADGRFHFPEVTRPKGLLSLLPLPGDVTIIQELTVRWNGEDIPGWTNAKRDFERNGETGKPLNFRCDLDRAGDDSKSGICELI